MSTLSPPHISMRERLRTEYHWTPRQRQVLDLIAQGKSNPEIAAALEVSLQGAKWHVSEILDKLDATSREEAADYWRRYNGLAPRFARVFRGITGLAAVKWAGAATGIAAVAAGGIAIAAVAASNGGDDGGSAAADASATPSDDLLERLRANEWVLVDVAGVPARDDVEATLRFTDPEPQAANVVPQPGTAGWAEGRGSCNGFNGATDIAGDEIRMRDIWRTSMLCPAIEQEERYLDALGKAERFAFDGDQLLIFAAGYDAPLRFDPRPAKILPIPSVTPEPAGSTPTDLSGTPADYRVISVEEVALLAEPKALVVNVEVKSDQEWAARFREFTLVLEDGTELPGSTFEYWENDPDSINRTVVPAGEATLKIGFVLPGDWVDPSSLIPPGASTALDLPPAVRLRPD